MVVSPLVSPVSALGSVSGVGSGVVSGCGSGPLLTMSSTVVPLGWEQNRAN